MLANSLPDKYGNQLIEQWLARNGRSPQSMNPVEKLCFIGSRGMGALEFEPAQIKAGKTTFSIEVKSLVDIARKMLTDREAFKTDIDRDEERAMNEILKIGTSAGGARPKAGDYIVFKARMDLIIGLIACSAEDSNNESFKPIHYQVYDGE